MEHPSIEKIIAAPGMADDEFARQVIDNKMIEAYMVVLAISSLTLLLVVVF